MYTHLLNIWESLRSSFWFVPSVLMIGATLAAWLLGRLDVRLAARPVEFLWWMQLSPSSARSILSSIVGAIVTSTGVVFSITIVALSLASSQFGSRLIRTYRNRRSTHFTLGLFVATSLYCILVLASVRDNDEGHFVPVVSVTTGIILTVVCLAALVWYIHDISRAIQAPNVIQSSARDLNAAIDRLFPESPDEPRSSAAHKRDEVHDDRPLLEVACDRVGYVQAIKYESVVDLAAERDLLIRLQLRPGDFVQPGYPLAALLGAGEVPDIGEQREDLERCLRNCLIVGENRTPVQDVRYAFNELVEIAVRALSPGINDPFTAITCVDHIHAALAKIQRRPAPSGILCDSENSVRCVVTPLTAGECLDGSLSVIEHYARNSPIVRDRISQALKELRPRQELDGSD